MELIALKEELRFVETTVMALCVMIGGDWRMLLSSVGNLVLIVSNTITYQCRCRMNNVCKQCRHSLLIMQVAYRNK